MTAIDKIQKVRLYFCSTAFRVRDVILFIATEVNARDAPCLAVIVSSLSQHGSLFKWGVGYRSGTGQ